MTAPRRFHLQRDTDVSGTSGTGRVADGVQWPDGTASLRWRGPYASTVHWDSITDAEYIHGHGGHTRIVWDDPAELVVTACQTDPDMTPEVAEALQALATVAQSQMQDCPEPLFITREEAALVHDLTGCLLAPAPACPAATEWQPPPPGDRREQLPDHLLALINVPDYTSTACELAQLLATAPKPAPTSSGAIPDVPAYVARLHRRCRINNKYTGVTCDCSCHGPCHEEGL